MTIDKPLHPGEIINEIIIEGAGLSVAEASKRLDVNRTTLSKLINGHAGISPDMALRLSKFFPNTDIKFWLDLQRDYDIWLIQKHQNKIHVKAFD